MDERITVMLPLPPVFAWTLAAIGVAALTKVLAKEWQRVNDELDAHERAAQSVAPERLPKLRQDPHSGIYRPE
jgi:hypothetical protein